MSINSSTLSSDHLLVLLALSFPVVDTAYLFPCVGVFPRDCISNSSHSEEKQVTMVTNLESFTLRTPEPNNVVRAVQTNTTCDMVGKMLTSFKLNATHANIMQHSTTWCTNERNMLCPTRCANMLLSFAWYGPLACSDLRMLISKYWPEQ